MLAKPQPPRIHLPKGRQDHIKSAGIQASFIDVVCLHVAATFPKVCLRGE